MANDSGKDSMFNEAALKMQRLDELQGILNKLIINALYFDPELKLYSYQLIPGVLNGLYLELSGHLSDIELETAERYRTIINNLLTLKPVYIKKRSVGLSNSKYVVTINRENLRLMNEILFKFQMQLRKWLEKHKLGTPEAKNIMKAAADQ